MLNDIFLSVEYPSKNITNQITSLRWKDSRSLHFSLFISEALYFILSETQPVKV